MNLKTFVIIVGATQLLSGCFLLGSGSKSIVSANQQLYTPAVRNGVNTTFSEITSANGYTAYMGNPDGTVSEVRVRTNEARTIAYVSRDGGPEVEYTPQGATLANPLGNVTLTGSYLSGTFENANGDTFYVSANNSSHGIVGVNSRELGASNYARGYGGLQSAPEDLPDSANYSGRFYTHGDIHTRGNMELNVDFANGDLGGTLTTDIYSDADFTGTIDGSVSDSRVSGAATIEGGATGTLDLAGAVYGTDEQYLYGGIAGTLTVGEDEFATGGQFNTYQQSSQTAE